MFKSSVDNFKSEVKKENAEKARIPCIDVLFRKCLRAKGD
jgi:hypothetical protein